MQVEIESPETEEILEVFQELGLESAEVKEQLLQLAKLSDLHTWNKRSHELLETRANTAQEDNRAELEPAS